MREAVEQILDGTYDYEKGALDFSCAKLEIELQKGETYEGSFTVYASEGKYTLGYITTTDPRMECLSTELHGNTEEIAFRFHGEWMNEGEVTKGEFRIVSNKGEYYLPYVVSVMHGAPGTEDGKVRNLLQFAGLAKSDWQEAVRVFYTSDFANVIKESGNQLYLAYQGLSGLPGNGQHVDEFLVATNKKQRIEYLVSEKKIYLENLSGVTEQPVNIFRNGWGYTRLEVYCEGDFLFTEKDVITEDDFLGNRYTLPLFIDPSVLHAGKNMGKLVLKCAHMTVEVPITIAKKRYDKEARAERLEYKKNMPELVSTFINFRLEKTKKADWLREITPIIDRMVSANEKDAATRLFQAHLLITKEQMNEAGWILEHVGELLNKSQSPTLEAYYFYLNTLYRKDDRDFDMKWQVERIYRESGRDWRVAWLLLFMSEEYDREPMARWNFLQEQFENGCRSPLIYLEAWLLVNENPTLLRRLDAFEMQVLYFGKKQGNAGIEVLEQVVYLAERVKEFHPLLFGFLTQAYTKKADERILKEICTQLIKGNRLDGEAHEWLVKGVAAELRITNLYEYYMMSMDLEKDEDIPKQVLLYFMYQTNLDYLHNAYLFYYVTKRERMLAEIYQNYRPRMELFVREQVGKRRINKHLAYLYRHFLSGNKLDEADIKNLSFLYFTHEITLEQDDMKYVVVCQPNHLQEQKYPVSGRKAWVPLYGKANLILFENYQGIRFACNIAYKAEELVLPSELLDDILTVVKDNPALDIYMYERPRKGIANHDMEVERWRRLARYAYLADGVRGDVAIRIMQHYYQRDDRKGLSDYLNTLAGSFMSADQRGEAVRYMVLCGSMDLAYDWMLRYGNCKVEDKILLALLEDRIEKCRNEYQYELVLYAFTLLDKGVYSGNLIAYLSEHYQGLLRDLKKIWKASKEYILPMQNFCRRFVEQTLFSGYFVAEQSQVFKELVLSGKDEELVRAYLAKHSYDYFVRDHLIQREVLLEISRLQSSGQSVDEICQLAYLKYYAENREEIQDADTPVIRYFLDSVLKKGIRLSCLMELREYSTLSTLLEDRTIVEYHADSQVQPVIYYLITREDTDEGEYLMEPMNQVKEGIFVKEFILFFGESVQYYIVERGEAEDKLTQSGTMQRVEMLGEELSGRYGMINDMIISKTMQDYSTFDNLLEEYYKTNFYNRELFVPR